MKIVILDGYTVNPGDLSWEGLAALGDLEIHEWSAPEEVVSHIGDAEAAFSNKTVLTREQMAVCPNLKFVGLFATGTNVIDCAAARELGITVCNVPAYSTPAVAQAAFALLLELTNRTGHHDTAVHAGRWCASRDFCFWDYPIVELAGKTMGIIGFGSIGKAAARIAKAFGMRVLAHSRSTHPDPENLAEQTDLDTLLAESDVISLHCPLTEETRGIIGREAVAKMKKGAILINTSRGPLVDEAALAEALNAGRLSGAGVDVVSVEPVRPDNPLLSAKNCIITPHLAWASFESRQRLLDVCVANLRGFLEGRPQNVVS